MLSKHEKSSNHLKEYDSYAEPPKEVFDQVLYWSDEKCRRSSILKNVSTDKDFQWEKWSHKNTKQKLAEILQKYMHFPNWKTHVTPDTFHQLH